MVKSPDANDESGAQANDLLRRFLASADAPCPACGYNLRGCADNKCPECGRTVELHLGSGIALGPALWAAAGLWLAALPALVFVACLTTWSLKDGWALSPDERWTLFIVPLIVGVSQGLGGIWAARWAGRGWSRRRSRTRWTIAACWALSLAVIGLWWWWVVG